MSNPNVTGHDPIPSLGKRSSVTVRTDKPGSAEVGALAVPVVSGEDPPDDLGVDTKVLASAGFTAARGQTLVLPHPDGVVRVAVGLGPRGVVDATLVRDVVAEFARAVPHHLTLAVELPQDDTEIGAVDFAQAATEGVMLAPGASSSAQAGPTAPWTGWCSSRRRRSSRPPARVPAAGRSSRTHTTSGATWPTARRRR